MTVMRIRSDGAVTAANADTDSAEETVIETQETSAQDEAESVDIPESDPQGHASGTDHTLAPTQPAAGGQDSGAGNTTGHGIGAVTEETADPNAGAGDAPEAGSSGGVTADAIVGTWRATGNCTTWNFYADGTGDYKHDSFAQVHTFTWSVNGGVFQCSSNEVKYVNGTLCEIYYDAPNPMVKQ